MNRCNNCRYWSSEPRCDLYPDDYKGGALIPWEFRACLKVVDTVYYEGNPLTEQQRNELPLDIAFLDVTESAPNMLMTGPEFGCIHFEHLK